MLHVPGQLQRTMTKRLRPFTPRFRGQHRVWSLLLSSLLELGLVRSGAASSGGEAKPERVPRLSEVVRLAAKRAPDVILAQSEVEVGRAEYAGARLPPIQNPYAELTLEKGYGDATATPGFTGSLWVPVEVAGQRSRRIAETDALLRWREASLVDVRARAIGNALSAFGSAAALSEKVHVLEAIVEIAGREADFYRSRLRIGDALLREAKLAEAEAARGRALLEQARADVQVALGELNRATGMSYDVAPADAAEPPSLDLKLDARVAATAPGPRTSSAEASFLDRRRRRAARESMGPLSFIVQGGRGTHGEAWVGGGLAYTFPVFQRNQAEQARAEALRQKALTETTLRVRIISSKLDSLGRELGNVRGAVRVLTEDAIPAQEGAVEAAVETHRSGKGDWLTVLVSRRDLGRLRLDRLDLLQREWRLLGEFAALTGAMP